MDTKKILLVEDDDSLASVYIKRFEGEGFNVKRVDNGKDALNVAVEFKPDITLLDVMLPKLNGFAVLEQMRNNPEVSSSKIIILSALGQDSDKAKAEQLGANDYFVKSQVGIAEVVEKVKHHVGTTEDELAPTA